MLRYLVFIIHNFEAQVSSPAAKRRLSVKATQLQYAAANQKGVNTMPTAQPFLETNGCFPKGNLYPWLALASAMAKERIHNKKWIGWRCSNGRVQA